MIIMYIFIAFILSCLIGWPIILVIIKFEERYKKSFEANWERNYVDRFSRTHYQEREFILGYEMTYFNKYWLPGIKKSIKRDWNIKHPNISRLEYLKLKRANK